MGQAEELLNSLAGTDAYSEEVNYVTIDSERFMIVPEHLKKLGVSPDHGVNTIHFVGPRYSENGTDLSTMDIWANYMREDGYVDAGHCENVKVDTEDENLLHYDWVITRNVTEIHGKVMVLVCAKTVDEAGMEEDHWNSEICRDFYVSEGFEVQETVISQYPDLVEYMLLRVATVENKTTKDAMLSYVEQYLEEDPSVIIEQLEKIIAEQPIQEYVNEYLDGYVDIRTTTNRTLEGSYAGAYEMVSMAGVSEQITTEGYQLFDASRLVDKSIGGATLTNNGDGSFTLSGSGALTDVFAHSVAITHEEMVKLLKVGTLTCNFGSTSYPNMYVQLIVDDNIIATPTNKTDVIGTAEVTQSFLDNETSYLRIGFYGTTGETIVTGTMKPMLYQDGDGTWEPFTGGETSPSSEYEQEIKGVGPDITIKTVNNNLLSVNDMFGGLLTSANFNVDLSSAAYVTCNVYLPAGTYTASFDRAVYVVRQIMDGVLSQPVSNNAHNITKYTFTTATDGVVGLSWRDMASTTDAWDMSAPVQIEPGDIVTPYVEHQESSARITLPDELRQSDIICKKNNRWGINRKRTKRVFDGVTESWGEGVSSDRHYIYLKDGTLAIENGALLSHGTLSYEGTWETGNFARSGAKYFQIWTDLTPDEWKAFLVTEHAAGTPVTLEADLVTPTWEELDDSAQTALDNLQVFDGVTHVFVEGTDVQPIVLSKYGTSETGARTLTNTNRVEKHEEEIVECLENIDIQHTTETTIHGTKDGGLRLVELQGNTEKYVNALRSTCEFVAQRRGYYKSDNGDYISSTVGICNRYPIPCKVGDVIRLTSDVACNHNLLYYGADGFIKLDSVSSVKESEQVVPAGVEYFNVNFYNSADSMAKVTLTVNGKYLGCIRGHGKNFFDDSTLVNLSNAPIEMTNHSFETAETWVSSNIANMLKPNTKYTVSCDFEPSGSGYVRLAIGLKFSTYEFGYDNTNTSRKLMVTFTTPSNISTLVLSFYNGTNIAYKVGYIQIEEGETDTDFEPFKETIAWYYTEQPPRLGDNIFEDSDGLFKIHRNRGNVIFDGSSDENISFLDVVNGYARFTIKHTDNTPIIQVAQNILCDKLSVNSTLWANPSGESLFTDISTQVGVFGFIVHGPTTLEEVIAWVSEKTLEIEYELATPTIEILDPESQKALHSLRTFNDITYIEFDSVVQPKSVEFDYGVSDITSTLLKVESDVAKVTPMEKKYIMIGDSYGVGYTPEGTVTGWPHLLQKRLGLSNDNCIIQVQNGTGFPGEGDQFITLLSRVPDDGSVTDILVAGGFNDIGKGYDAVIEAIGKFKDYAKEHFPNADLKIAFIGGTKNHTMRYGCTEAMSWYTKACTVLGITMLQGCEFALRRYHEVFSSDGFHPNELGEQYISEYLFRALQGYGNNTYIEYVQSTVTAVSEATSSSGLNGIGAMICDGVLHCSSLYPIVVNYDNYNLGMADGSTFIQLGTITGGLMYGNIHHNIQIPVTAIVRNLEANYEVPGVVVIANSGIAFSPYALGSDSGFAVFNAVQSVFIPKFSFCADALMC